MSFVDYVRTTSMSRWGADVGQTSEQKTAHVYRAETVFVNTAMVDKQLKNSNMDCAEGANIIVSVLYPVVVLDV
jgi:hypothetical protein